MALTEQENIVRAAYRLTEALSDHSLSDLGPALSCSEVESLANLLRSVGESDGADLLLAAHEADDDREGDEHYGE
jgi:hypothetical protein